jgi:hypothetical protein
MVLAVARSSARRMLAAAPDPQRSAKDSHQQREDEGLAETEGFEPSIRLESV